jgi:cytochrome c-type biogenesis protein CcmH
MSERTVNRLLIALIAIMGVTLALIVSTSPANINRAETIGSRIKCPVCQGESIADSPSQLARDMMSLISERVDSGVPDAQIIAEIEDSYSGAILLDPPASGSTLVLWIAPFVVLIIGLLVILWWRGHPAADPDVDAPATGGSQAPDRSRIRLLVGGIVLLAAFGGITAAAANSLQDRASTTEGLADLQGTDLSQVSNETMEAVIAANSDNPQVNAMRLALAERYFESGDYQSAFPHYLIVAQSPDVTDDEAITALVRLGWMTYDGNGESDTAVGLIDQALDIDPKSQIALYLKAEIEWCGLGDVAAATSLYDQLLADPDLPDDSQAQIEADLADMGNGAGCP